MKGRPPADEERIARWTAARGLPTYRAGQIRQALYGLPVEAWEDLTMLPLPLREALRQDFLFPRVAVRSVQQAADGTAKFSLELADGAVIEGVLIPTPDRLTACISSQVGCSLDCAFCATGRMQRVRNLTDFEIARQVLAMGQWAHQHMGRRITNVVLMGMGEPLLNYSQVARAVRALHQEKHYQYGWRRITLSTSGIAKGIRRMADDGLPCRLALSLHSAVPEKRARIMSISRTNSVTEVHEAVRYYVRKTGRKVTLEYVMLDGVNDSIEDVRALVRFVSTVASKVNLIEYNEVPGLPFRAAPPERVAAFVAFLRRKGVRVTLRHSRGKDIMAACGQLANQMIHHGTTQKSPP